MNIQDFGSIGELVAAVATLATLIYLAQQIRQNTRAVRGTTMDSITSHTRDELKWYAEIAHLFRKGQEQPGSLSDADLDQLSAWLIAALRSRQNEFFQHRQGLLDSSMSKSHVAILQGNLSPEWAREWWHEWARDVLAPEFCDYVDSVAFSEKRSGLVR